MDGNHTHALVCFDVKHCLKAPCLFLLADTATYGMGGIRCIQKTDIFMESEHWHEHSSHHYNCIESVHTMIWLQFLVE